MAVSRSSIKKEVEGQIRGAKPSRAMLAYKEGGETRPGLYANINRRKKLGISRPKSKSTISKEAYSNMKKGFPKKKSHGGMIDYIKDLI